MDPLSVTASVIAITTFALQSSKAAYDFVSGLAEAPQAIAKSKASLHETQKTLGALQQMLTAASEGPNAIEAVLQSIELDETLKMTKRLCDRFIESIASYTSHSTAEQFSKRDRLAIVFRESKIVKFNEELSDCQRTVSMVVVSINLIITTRTADEVGRVADRFRAQEQALADLNANLHPRLASSASASEGDTTSHEDESVQLTSTLQKVCQQALSATQAKRTGQKFGNMSADNQSYAMQGIVGEARDGTEQSFGSLKASNKSRGFQGQMDAASFAVMFGRQPQ
ncbi:hypothetical protein F5Y14DRAFT_6313 [Nemania sp. NC0429]|nr:hypothetical protein F5Y14DRAFT_6313 [Nemania sp. NC0429]